MEKGVAHSTSSTGAEIPNPEGRTEKTIKNYQVHHEIVKLLKIKKLRIKKYERNQEYFADHLQYNFE